MTAVFRTSLLMALAASTALGARAADVNDLAPAYQGGLHHNTIASGEESSFSFQVVSVSPNGTFVAALGPNLTMNGKVTPAGKMTFTIKGSANGISLNVTKGKGQLSATGRFIVGSLQLKATPSIADAPNGPYTFHVEASDLAIKANGGVLGLR